jgi:TonB family protein
LVSAHSGTESQPAKQADAANLDFPKVFACRAPQGTGVVSLRIVIDSKGSVSQVKALSGSEQFFTAAEACAKTWKYEHPPAAPVSKTVYVSFYAKECPGPESQRGEIQWSWGLWDKSGNGVAYIDGAGPAPPAYPEEQRKAGIAGRMVLSVSLNSDGSVKEIRVARGLSPVLNKTVIDWLRPVKFKVLDSKSDLQNLRFQIDFHASCAIQSVAEEK